MRTVLFCTLLLTQVAASAGTLEKCQGLKSDTDGIQLCVETEHLRSWNELRKMSTDTREAVRKKDQEDGNKARLRAYRTLEAKHVRERKKQCHARLPSLERNACEADMNFAHIEQLAQFSK